MGRLIPATPFTGRVNELNRLEGIYGSGKFECVILHGRMRVGKTALLREFVRDKKFIYFAAQETHSGENLTDLSRSIDAFRNAPAGQPRGMDRSIRSFDDALRSVFEMAIHERIVFIIDDYQFLAVAQRGMSELICEHIDTSFLKSRLMLVICGSSESVMEKETLGFHSPFHGRRTAQMKLMPFSFFEAKRYYSEFSLFDIAVLYGMTGGVPKYLELMDSDRSIEDNIRQSFFDTSSYLFEETANLLRREVRDPAYYNAVLRAIAAGCTKNSEIAARVGLETSAVTAYLNNLISFGLVAKYTPIAEKSGRKTIYEICDNFFRFWYRFVPDNISYIMSGQADKIWRSFAGDIPAFMSLVFTDICRQWLEQQNQAGNLPFDIVETGRWWGFDPALKSDVYIPIVAYSDDNHAIFCDCEWSDEPVPADTLASLVERSRLLRYPDSFYFLFSKSGFSDECADLAQHFGANLVMFE